MFLLLSSFMLGCLPHTSEILSTKSTVEIPVLRSNEQGERLFIGVELPIVGKQYFMVDTGASVSAINVELVNAMKLHSSRKNGYLTGVSGRVPWIETVVPELQLGSIKLNNVAFAVSVEGLPTNAGIVPIAGIIGNNVWEQFIVDIDYGLERIQLHNSFEFSESAQDVSYDSQQLLAPIELAFGAGNIQTVLANVDTGSSGLIINSIHAPQLLKHGVQSKETIIGVGADRSNLQDYVMDTVSVNIDGLKMGGHTQSYSEPAILLTPRNESFISLIGYQALENNRLIIGYQEEKLQLVPSTSDLPVRNLHKDYLQSIQWGTMSGSPMTEVQLHFILGDNNAAVRKLKRLISKDDQPEYHIALANYYYTMGKIEEALKELEQVHTLLLLDLGLLDAMLLSYIHADQMDKAHLLLSKELKREKVMPHTYWLASLLDLINDDIAGATDWLYKAQKSGSEEYLVQRALLKQRNGDTAGTIATLRMDVARHPLGNHSLWFLAQTAKGTPYEPVARTTIDNHMSLRNSRRGALDFLAAAHFELGNTEIAEAIASEGKARDCATLKGASKINCDAWYEALVHLNVEANIQTMEQIVSENPGRSDFTDTLAVLYKAGGQIAQSVEMSRQAMIFGGSDPYMIWQALSESSR